MILVSRAVRFELTQMAALLPKFIAVTLLLFCGTFTGK